MESGQAHLNNSAGKGLIPKLIQGQFAKTKVLISTQAFY